MKIRILLAVAVLLFSLSWAAAQSVIISEFQASNQNGIVDEDGDTSDWIELYNNDTVVANLAGWHLTDDSGDATKWTFPAVTIEPKGFLLVFASKKNRTVLNQPLHTNFSLSANGGYLALNRPTNVPATEFNPYPAQYPDKPYGYQQTVTTTNYVNATTAALKYFIPPTNALGTTWTARTFNDGSWTNGTNGVGYEATVPGWLFKTWFANVFLGNLAAANGVIATPSQQTAFYQQTEPVVNYLDTGAEGHYAPNTTPSWLGVTEHDNFVVEATGIITIPAAGTYTFGVNSDDGFELKVGPVGGALTTVCNYDGGRGASDTLGTFTFGAAGEYQIRVMIFQGGGGAGGEVFAAQGNFGSWNATNFHLIGDTAAGGLAVKSVPASAAGGLSQFIHTSVLTAMQGVSPSAYVRYKFNVASPAAVTSLTMPIRYNDGFIAWLNGVEIARRNAPAGTPSNATAALATRAKLLGTYFETIDLKPVLDANPGLLVSTNNVLAIQGLNVAANDGNFLVNPELDAFTATLGGLNYFTAATPGTFDTATIYNKVSPVVASVGHGFFTAAQTVALSTGTAGATIRYTFDGSTPTLASATSATYAGPITINKTTVLRYAAFKSGADPSDTTTQTYIFVGDVVAQEPTGTPPVVTNPTGATQATTTWPVDAADTSGSGYRRNGQFLNFGMDPNIVNVAPYNATIATDLQAIPTLSLVTDLPNLFDPSTGIYVNAYQDTVAYERAVSLELIYPDGTTGFIVNCGTRIRGGYSRSPDNPKHAWRIFFRDTYGPSSLNFPLFGKGVGAQSFAKFDIRNAQNYSWSFDPGDGSIDTYAKDEWNRDTQLAMGDAASRGGYYHLYVDGQYWGLTNIDERPEGNFGATYFGGDPNNFDTIKVAPDSGYVIQATDGEFGLPVPGDPGDPQQLGRGWYRLWLRCDQGLSATNTAVQNDAVFQELLGKNPDGTANVNFPVLLDPVSLSDYMLVIYYSGNLDAAISNFIGNAKPNNWFGTRDRTGASGGFKFMLHDSEHTLLDVNADRFGPWPAGSTAQQGASAFSYSSPQYLWQQLINSPEFRAVFADRVQKHAYNGGPLTPASGLARWNARTAMIDRAIVGESARWGDSKHTPAYTRDTWLAAVNNVRLNFFPNRTANFIAQLRTHGVFPSIETAVFNQRGGSVASGFNVTLTNPNASPAGQTIYYTLDGTDPRLAGGAIAPTALVYSTPIPIGISKTVRVRIKSATEWSGLDEATFYVLQNYAGLFVTEVHYHPLANGATSGDEYEFLELKNTSANTMDLSGLSFTAGLTYSFPTGTTLAPGAFYVLVRNAPQFAARYPGVAYQGIYTGKLSNSGDTITLSRTTVGTIFSFNYKTAGPWPVSPDGAGFSLVLKNPASNPSMDDSTSWRASAAIGGSPGADDPAVNIAGLVVNEALVNSVSGLTDTIELFNPTGAAVDVGNWWLTDSTSTPKKYRIPAGTILAAGGFVTFNESQFNPTPGVGTSFALDANGEQVYLYSGDAGGALTGYSHGFDFKAAEQNVSFGRYLNSVGDETFPRQISRTFAAVNSGPLVGPLVLNEIQYFPAAGYDEFVEIKNISASTVLLYDPANVANTWHISGVSYNFPTGQSIAAGALALVVPIDPAAFRTKYNVPAGVQIFGPYTGALQNSGERLSLEQPGPPFTVGAVTTVPYIVIDSVRYNDKTPWPVSAAGSGPSLQRLSATVYGDDPANWFASGITPGTANAYNLPPSVTLLAPANNATYTLPAAITLQASASDPDGTIVKVEFYDGSTKIGEATSAPYIFTWASASPGPHAITAKAIDSGLAVTVSTTASITVNAPAIGNGAGLTGNYYADPNLTLVYPATPTFSRTDPVINFTGSWPNTGGIGNARFLVRWLGQILPRLTQTYTFKTVSDDGVRLWVNGQLIIDNWTYHGDTINYGFIDLTAGQLYDIRMEFFQGDGGETATLAWSAVSGGLQEEIIPTSQLYPTGAPIIVTPPQPQTVEAGFTATFSVLAAGTAPFTYQWRYNGGNIAGATGQSLVLNEVLLSQAGNYSVVVSNAFAPAATSANAALTVTFTDTDGDGIPDWWETARGLNPNSAADATQDKDGDGKTNREEFLAGTDPNDPTSVLRAVVAKVANGWKITFTAQSRKSYTVQYKNALPAATWTNLQTVAEQPGVRTIDITDTSAGAQGTRFYRVITPAAP